MKLRWKLLTVLAVVAGGSAAWILTREHPPIAAAPAGETVTLSDGIVRQDLRFPCGDDMCAAWLYLPKTERKPPVVVMGHGFAGTRDIALPRFAERIAREDIAVVVFDYRHFGASGGAPRQLVDAEEQLADWRLAVAFARSLDEVDSTHLGLWGTSMGAGHALITSASDGYVRAVVAQAPLVDTDVDTEATNPGTWWAVRLLFNGWGDLISRAYGGEAVTMPAIAPSGGFGMIVDDRAQAAFERLVEPGATYRNEVVASSVFNFGGYNPMTIAQRINSAVLFIASRDDRFAPFAAVEAFAAKVTIAKVVTFDGDHFDIYAPPAADLAADEAARFFKEHLAQE